MSDVTARFSLPFIIPGQAQKELYHNEALIQLDMLLHVVVEMMPIASPPATPEEGQCWIVADNADGLWQGYDKQIACWSESGWRFSGAKPGMLVWSKANGHWIHFDGVEWSLGVIPVAGISVDGNQVIGPRQPSISDPSGGAVIDAEVRAATSQIIATLKSHGLID